MLALQRQHIRPLLWLQYFLGYSWLPGSHRLNVAFAQTLRLLPTSGMNGFKSLILPAVSISLSSTMMITRMLQSRSLGDLIALL